jgi:hypothetical protein
MSATSLRGPQPVSLAERKVQLVTTLPQAITLRQFVELLDTTVSDRVRPALDNWVPEVARGLPKPAPRSR